MIKEIGISNYKSIDRLELELGRVNVFIGENGCGKSNILEAITLISASSNNKLDTEFLTSRGVRVTEPKLMRSAFDKDNFINPIDLSATDEKTGLFSYTLINENQPYSKWHLKDPIDQLSSILALMNEFNFDLSKYQDNLSNPKMTENFDIKKITELKNILNHHKSELNRIKFISSFLIYSPENKALRIFEKEGQIEPLGINGEGLFKLLKVLNLEENKEKINEIKEHLHFIDWFEDFEIPENLVDGDKHLKIVDRFLDTDFPSFDQKSSNEGFLFLLFYFALLVSKDTPAFFAIDNIDTSLNPKLCTALTKKIVELTKKHDKQVILTTHNPSILDGLNLDDDEQRLFVIYRNNLGHTKAKRILKKNDSKVKLSEAFMNGYIGGLPKNF